MTNFFRETITRFLALWYPFVKWLYPFPSVASIDETLDELIAHKKSICRYGDGEFLYLLDQKDLPFQAFDPKLEQKLRQVLLSNHPKVMIALPIGFYNMQSLTLEGQRFWKSRIVWLYPRLRRWLLTDRVYYNAHMTRIYYDIQDKTASARYVHKIRQIWEGRDVVIIEGEKSRLGLGNDLFAATASLRRIVAPAHHAFAQAEPIKAFVDAHISKDTLLLIALGPTATVMAYDFAEMGYQAVDIGNIDIEYEWFLRNTTQKVKIPFKYTGEVAGGREVEAAIDATYHAQIMARFGVEGAAGQTTAANVELAWLIYGSSPEKRQLMQQWSAELGISRVHIANNHPKLFEADELRGTNESYEFSAYEQLLQELKGDGPYLLVNDTLFRNHGHQLWGRLVKQALQRPGQYPTVWGDWRSESIVFPEKPAQYLASWIFLIPDRATLTSFRACLHQIMHEPLPEASTAYQTYITKWLQSDKWFSGWHGPSDATTLQRKQRTVRLEHALSLEMRARGLEYKSLGHFAPLFYHWIRLYDRVRTRWMAVMFPGQESTAPLVAPKTEKKKSA